MVRGKAALTRRKAPSEQKKIKYFMYSLSFPILIYQFLLVFSNLICCVALYSLVISRILLIDDCCINSLTKEFCYFSFARYLQKFVTPGSPILVHICIALYGDTMFVALRRGTNVAVVK